MIDEVHENCRARLATGLARWNNFSTAGGGGKVKNQVSSCNMIRWFSHHPLKSCWWLNWWLMMIVRQVVIAITLTPVRHTVSAICNFWPQLQISLWGGVGPTDSLTWPSRTPRARSSESGRYHKSECVEMFNVRSPTRHIVGHFEAATYYTQSPCIFQP